MIIVFFSENGYVITGEGIEITQRCSPALTINGDRIFRPIHHTYKVLYLALSELRRTPTSEDVMVYNDSRIIDELNGVAEPLDDSCSGWLPIIQRSVVPSITSVVLFRKKASLLVNQAISEAHSNMLPQSDRKAVAAIQDKAMRKTAATFKQKTIEKLKQFWFKGNNYGK